jgi:SSS family solute:Na+ symporter
MDIYRQMIDPRARDRQLVLIGMLSSVVILVASMFIAANIHRLGGSLFVYIQSLYAFFAPPFGAVFVLGILWRRINGAGAVVAVISGFVLGIGMKLYVQFVPGHPLWLEPYAMQGILSWVFCAVVCVTVSLATPPPRPQQVTPDLTFDWGHLAIFDGLGEHWYTSVVMWWGLFVLMTGAVIVLFSGWFL